MTYSLLIYFSAFHRLTTTSEGLSAVSEVLPADSVSATSQVLLAASEAPFTTLSP